MARKKEIKFSDKSHASKGIASTMLGILSIAVLAVLVILAFYSKGAIGIYAGVAGFLALIIAVIGLFTGFASFKERERYYLFSKIGSILNVLVIVVWIAVYIAGM